MWRYLIAGLALVTVGSLFGLVVGGRPVYAVEAADSTPRKPLHWRCWFDRQAHIQCLLDAPAAENATLPASGLAHPALPAIVAELRSHPASFKSRFVSIPVYSEPTDASFAGALASAVMCGRRSDCSVHYTPRAPHDNEIAAILQRHLGAPEGLPALALGNAR